MANTVPLGDSPIAGIGTRDFNNRTIREVSAGISRTNYRNALSDETLRKFRDSVYKVVSGWAPEDKRIILADYGDTGLLKSDSEEELNAVLTESLIIHLPPADLQSLYNDLKIAESKGKREVNRIRIKNRRTASKMESSLRNSVDNASKNVANKRTILTYRMARSSSFKGLKVPSYVKTQYRTLREELKEVLKNFNNMEISIIARDMEIEITENMNKRDLLNQIINKTCLYVDLIYGKQKKLFGREKVPLMSSVFSSREPYDNLLKYTSYAFHITGQRLIAPKEWENLRNTARKARAEIKVRSEVAKTAKKTTKKVKKKYGIDNAELLNSIKELSGIEHKNPKNRDDLTKYLKTFGDSGVLRNLPIDNLISIATKYGINVNKREYRDIDKLKADIYIAMASANIRKKKLETKLTSKKIGFGGVKKRQEISDKLSLTEVEEPEEKDTTINVNKIEDLYNFVSENIGKGLSESNEITRNIYESIRFNNAEKIGEPSVSGLLVAGNYTSESILKAITENDTEESTLKNIYSVITEWKDLSTNSDKEKDSKKSSKRNKNEYSGIVKEYQRHFNQEISKTPHNNKILFTKNGDEIRKDIGDILKKEGISLKIRENAKAGKHYPVTKEALRWAIDNDYQFAKGAYSFIAGDSLTNKPNPELVTIKGDGSFSVRPVQAGPQNNYSELSLPKHAEGILSNAIKVSVTKEKNSLNSKNIKYLSKNKIDAVYSVNSDYNTNRIIKSIGSLTNSLNSGFADLILGLGSPWISVGLNAGATTNPTLLAFGAKRKIENVAVNAISTAAETMSDVFMNTGGTITRAATGAKSIRSTRTRKPVRFATGGTSVITGDSPGNNMFSGGAKPELVTSNGDMKVIPLNKSGTEQRQKVSRMSTSERRSALATAISSHVVKYNYRLLDGTTDLSNSGEAIKVYDVKPGVTDVIEINGERFSIVEILSNINKQLAILSGSSIAGNNILSQIAAKPTVSVNNSGSSERASSGSLFPSDLDGILGGN